jgi:hypothetical protein
VGKRAADRPAVAHLLVGDLGGRAGHHAELGHVLEIGVARHRTYPPPAVLFLEAM